MDTQSSPYSKLLITAFTENELASLEKQPHFNTALAAVRSFGEFERMCAIGRRLLAKRPQRSTPLVALPTQMGPKSRTVRGEAPVDFIGG